MIEYSFSFNGEDFTGRFATKEEAIAEAKVDISEDDGNVIYIGQIKDVSIGVPVEWLLEQISDEAYDLVGEHAQDYLFHVKKEHQSELEEQLNNVLKTWMEKYNYTPNFWTVGNVEEVRITQ